MAQPIGTAFTYQGELKLSGAPAASADIQFTLWDAAGSGSPPAGGTQIGGMQQLNNVTLGSDGRFTALLNDAAQFGATPFGGDARWLQIAVRSPAGSGSFVTLGPRQRLSSTPNASYALNAGTAQTAVNATNATNATNAANASNSSNLGGQAPAFYTNANNLNAGTLPGARLAGTYSNALTFTNAANVFAGNGSGLLNLNASNLSSGSVPDARLSANVALRNAPNTFTASGNTFTANLGVGTAFASHRLTVQAPDEAAFRIIADGPFGSNGKFNLGDAQYVYIHEDIDDRLLIHSLGRTAMTASAVGIGTLDPTHKLTVQASGEAALRVIADGAFGSNGKFNFGDAQYVYLHEDVDDRLLIHSAGRTAMTASAVGIGTLDPTHKLTVQTTNEAALRIIADGAFGSNGKFNFGDAQYVYLHEDIDDRLLIHSSGRTAMTAPQVGIGTLSPTNRLTVSGNCNVTGTLAKGGGSFKIDHPLDPENKYLYHSFVESPDMMNVYNGNIRTDGNGLATIILPDWFEALNRDFRYQLTVIDEADEAAFVVAKVVRKVAGNQFTIRTNLPGVEVSWQVTGIRQDPFANANRIPVEEDKPAEARGKYLHPEALGRSAARGEYYSPLAPVRPKGEPEIIPQPAPKPVTEPQAPIPTPPKTTVSAGR